MVRNPGIVAGIILALVVGSSTRALAGGGRFVPLGSSAGETRRAENVTRDAAGNPLVGGSETVPKGGLREAAMYLIAPSNAVSKQTLTVAAGTRPRRTALYVPRGANIAVGRATDNTGSQSQALLWEDTAGDATPLTPLDKLGNSDSEGGKYYEDEKEGPGAHIIAVGVSYASDFSVFLPTIWTSDNGFVPQQLDLLPGGPMNGAARAIVRNDGMTIIAGTAVGPAGSSEAVIWNGMQVQAVLPRGSLLAANAAAISRDTRFVAGLGISAAFNSVPALWSDEDGDGLYELHTPALPAGLLRGAFNAVRDLPNARGDGPAAIAVGCSLGPTFEALIFDPDSGVRLLEDVLANDFGLDLQGFTLEDATDLSVGGGVLRVCGNGVSAAGQPDGWYAEVALDAAPCPGDLDGDSQVGLTDLAIMLSNFGIPSGATPEQGDLDGDGDVDLSDLATMLSLFGTSCA